MLNPFSPGSNTAAEQEQDQPEAGVRSAKPTSASPGPPVELTCLASRPFLQPSRLAAAPPASQATDTFLRRLAGQSVNKAGLNKNQASVNRTIYEASKGTKFYQREHEKVCQERLPFSHTS